MIPESKPSLEELAHHGVLGMHWGQHKAVVPSGAQVRTAASVTGKAAVVTGKAVGKGAVATAKAVGKGGSYLAHHKRLVAGGLVVAAILHDVGPVAYDLGKAGILVKAAKNRETAYKAGKIAVKALSSEASKVNYAKMARGAYKITTL